MQRLIFHIDVNSAYLSWEAMRRVKNGESDIRLIPAAIGGDKDKRTGIILAKSIPAKKYGIKTGEPVSMALRKCPDLYLVRPDFSLYVRCSHAFMDICRSYAPIVEQYSIDECFMDMSGTALLYPDPIELAYELKNKIRDELGFTVNIGISSNKLLAKMASDFEKPDKVHTLFPNELESKFWPLPVGELFSVGTSTAAKLNKAYIKTIGDLAKSDPERICGLLGQKIGMHLIRYANGIDTTPVLAQPEDAKGYNISTTLEEDVTDAERAHNILLALSDSVAARMRADSAKAYCLGVTIRSNDFKNKSHQRKLNEPTDITSEIYTACIDLFDSLWDKRTPLRLLGISLTNIVRDDSLQLELFPDVKKEKSRKVDQAIDNIRLKFGTDKVMRGSSIIGEHEVGRKYKAQLNNRKV
ncbi:MAG: DNA polymerase IV [Clostridia bacterium]|nr:DNA polymerase IV [Clostridia bacterium]